MSVKQYGSANFRSKNGNSFFANHHHYPNGTNAPIQRKEEQQQAATAKEEKKEAKRGNSFWKDLFTRPFKAIGRLFGSENYSKEELDSYLNYIKTAKKIEDRYDSDNKARAVVSRKDEFGTLSTDVKTLLIQEMIKGATLGADEGAIISLLRDASLDEMKAILSQLGREKLWGQFSGYNRRVIEAITLTEADLSDQAMLSKLKSLSSKELEDYKTNARVPAVSTMAWKLIQLKGITTPLDVGQVDRIDQSGTAHFSITGFNIQVLKDQSTGKQGEGAYTEVKVNPGQFGPNVTMDGVTNTVKSWVGPSDPVVTIQTFYDLGAKRSGSSGYGRGTTEEDKRKGHTTLGFHEGTHGLDALQYLKDHAPPTFSGQSGMSMPDFTTAIEDYNKAIAAYQEALLLNSIKATDCPGTPISSDQLEKVGAPRNTCE
ncbi:MAG TPA: hypothetical protein PKA00_04565 [Saprospiraceae bacterium]|nr:hypothetical protein [Saprospiraceae bacterium]HMQ82153.1 hypothetical protein [Saprospiraceae bacterium]